MKSMKCSRKFKFYLCVDTTLTLKKTQQHAKLKVSFKWIKKLNLNYPSKRKMPWADITFGLFKALFHQTMKNKYLQNISINIYFTQLIGLLLLNLCTPHLQIIFGGSHSHFYTGLSAVACEAQAVCVFNIAHGGEELLTYRCGSEDWQDSTCIFLHVYVSQMAFHVSNASVSNLGRFLNPFRILSSLPHQFRDSFYSLSPLPPDIFQWRLCVYAGNVSRHWYFFYSWPFFGHWSAALFRG